MCVCKPVLCYICSIVYYKLYWYIYICCGLCYDFTYISACMLHVDIIMTSYDCTSSCTIQLHRSTSLFPLQLKQPLELAIKHRRLDIVKVLLIKGAKLEFDTLDNAIKDEEE